MSEWQEELSVIATDADEGVRLDQFVAKVAEVSRSVAEKQILSGLVSVGGKTLGKNYRVKAGDELEILLPEPEMTEAVPQDIPLQIVYEDADIAVINKPVGMVVHPAPGNPDGTLVNALLFHCGDSLSGIGGVFRPGIVHRIDKDTSGLLVVAKNDASHRFLSEKLKTHDIRRVYYAVVIGNLKEDSGVVDAPIGRNPNDRKKMAVIRDERHHSRTAVTHWSVLARGFADGQNFTLVKCELETGRTHQIRVHLASIGHPILGDPLYGGDKTAFQAHHKDWISGQCLHAKELFLTHPATKREMHFACDLPDDMRNVTEKLFGK